MLKPNLIDIWHGDVVANSKDALHMRSLLTNDELDRADRYRFEGLQQLFVQRRGILRIVLGEYLQLPPAAIRFRMNAYGKPFLCEQCNAIGLQFSVSHSKDRLLIAVTLGSQIGVDIEVIRQDLDFIGLAKSFFAQEDIADILSQNDEAGGRKRFFEIWTGKEAYVKAIGEGLSIPLDEFSIDMLPAQPILRYAKHKSQLDGVDYCNWNFEKLQLNKTESACIAYHGASCKMRFLPLPTLP